MRKTIGILAVTQIASWGSIYYAFAVLATDIGRDLALRPEIIYGGYAWSLLVAGLCATPIGMLVDRFGGRRMMALGSLCAALGLALLGLAQSAAGYLLAWSVVGMSMGAVLYEAAFATINHAHAAQARRLISVLTLFGGFASTLYWPLSLQLNTQFGWRDTYLLYAAVQLLLCAPLHAMLPARVRDASGAQPSKASHTFSEAVRDPVFWRLAGAFAANSLVFSALSVHLIPLLHRMGHPVAAAVFFAALIGPMQVAGRISEMALARHATPQVVGAVIFAIVPVALLLLLWEGGAAWAAIGFCLLYGVSNGVITIVRGTLPQKLFGPENYGAISGAMAAPSLVCKAAGPLAVAAVSNEVPSAQFVTGILSMVALVSLASYLLALRAQAVRPARRYGVRSA
ncbi:MFS transporter [Massilia glaciei]|uniref:MFS transporter n=1 Tax=Massilia glaciei TaxID=1524097 RepID=A0A2U2HLS6_9BURK|nr:MFS transporter [Massilia glaciei]PWF48478.1 MFS transporter [Massilia glaciei]